MTKIIKLDEPFKIQPYTKKDLCKLYNVSKYIMSKWLKAIEIKLGQKIGYSYSNAQVQIIVNEYGIPGQYIDLAA